MKKIEIIGSGNVATHLVKAFLGKADLNVVNPRTMADMRVFADIYLVCVSDSAIAEVAEKAAYWMPHNSVLAHTSGTTPLSVISNLHKHTGVFYPLQTFTVGVELDYSEIPFFIEGSDKLSRTALREAAWLISEDIRAADSDMRRELHLASVIASNFANHLWALSDKYMMQRGLDFNVMAPLLRETLRKAMAVGPAQAQTGPARRHDNQTISRHIDMLADDEKLQQIYKLLSESIENFEGPESVS